MMPRRHALLQLLFFYAKIKKGGAKQQLREEVFGRFFVVFLFLRHGNKMTVFGGVLSRLLLWQLLGLLTVLSSKSGKFNPFLDPSLNDISSHTLDQCFCEVNAIKCSISKFLLHV